MNGYKLLIVDSPIKAETFGRSLDSDWKIVSTWGHLEDLPADRIGIDLATDQFEADFSLSEIKRKVVMMLSQAIQGAESVYLAMEPGPDGEAIASEVLAYCGDFLGDKPYIRVDLTALDPSVLSITPRMLDDSLLDIYYLRRTLDRISSFTISPLANVLMGETGLIYGRLAGIALRLIVERERELSAPTMGSPLEFNFTAQTGDVDGCQAWVVSSANGNGESRHTDRLSDEQIDRLIKSAPALAYHVSKIISVDQVLPAPSAFNMPSLLIAAEQEFGWPIAYTMRVAHSLYERGLITYPQTMGTNLTVMAASDAANFIEQEYGASYVGGEGIKEGMFGIYPTSVSMMTPDIGEDDGSGQRLYMFIRQRFLASRMASAVVENVQVLVTVGKDKQTPIGLILRTDGMRVRFQGFLSVNPLPARKLIGEMLSTLKQGEMLTYKSTNRPPSPSAIRFSSASLFEWFVKRGVGIYGGVFEAINSVLNWEYAKEVKGVLVPTERGIALYEFLCKSFAPIFTLDFGVQVEKSIGRVQVGAAPMGKVIQAYWKTLQPLVFAVGQHLEQRAVARLEAVQLNEICPRCGKPLVRVIREEYGPIVSCSNYPICPFTRGAARPIKVVEAAFASE